MFFLTSYGFLNLSAGMEGLIGSPSWRPSFKTPWYVSLLGAALCLAIMVMLDPGATIAASIICGAIYYVTGRREMTAMWGDVRRGILVMIARFAIYSLARLPPDPRSWQPNFLVLTGAPSGRMHLVEFADAVSHGKGFLTVAAVIPEVQAAGRRIGQIEEAIGSYLEKRQIPALVQVHTADEVMDGARSIVQSSGVGPLHPNTVILGLSRDPERLSGYARLVLLAHRLERNLILLNPPRAEGDAGQGRALIDVWWGGQRRNAGLMLALGYLLQTSPEWTGARLRIQTIVRTEEERPHALRRLEELIENGRINATADVVLQGDRSPFEVIREASASADMVFLGLRPPEPGEDVETYAAYYTDLLDRTHGHGATAWVLAAQDIDFGRIFE